MKKIVGLIISSVLSLLYLAPACADVSESAGQPYSETVSAALNSLAVIPFSSPPKSVLRVIKEVNCLVKSDAAGTFWASLNINDTSNIETIFIPFFSTVNLGQNSHVALFNMSILAFTDNTKQGPSLSLSGTNGTNIGDLSRVICTLTGYDVTSASSSS